MSNPVSILEQQRASILNQLIQSPDFTALTQWTTEPVFGAGGVLDTAGVPVLDGEGNPKSSIIIVKKGDIGSAILKVLADTGLSISLFYSQLHDLQDGQTQVVFQSDGNSGGGVLFQIEVQEMVTNNQGSNGTGLSALYCVERVCAALKNWQPQVDGADVSYCIQIVSPGCVNITTREMVEAGEDHWVCHFATKASLPIRPTP
jgi:hypothetical protein